ncbi:MAG: phage resistance protein, partial [Streptosporangiaceae bacterium]
SKGIGEKSTITEYVVTPQLAACFDLALDLVKSGVEANVSRAAYLDGSFGSGKSHFMAVLHAILSGDPDARGKKGLANIVAKHDSWLRGRRFLLVPYHLPDSQSLDAAILGGYVSHVAKLYPGKPLPAVYLDEDLLADARDMRQAEGDERFIAQLPAGDSEWGTPDWDSTTLDQAFAEPRGGPNRRRLVGDLLVGPFKRYSRTVRADRDSYVPLDDGLSVISQHAKNILGYDAIVLLLDELVLWLAGYLGDHTRVSQEAQKVSKLIESAEHERPAPIISFIPRQRDLRELVSQSAAGAEVTSLFDTLKYWDGRFEHIKLEDRNLPEIVHERLLRPKDDAARKAVEDAFNRAASVPPQTWETLLDTHGDKGDRDAFQLTYPFSPAFVHAMVDISGALQRERTALKLMQQLLVDYRDTLTVGQLMPLGAIFDVLASGADRPFTDKLRDEFDQAKRFYVHKLQPYLLFKHRTTDGQAAAKPAFRADDLIVKTLLLAALVPNVPALNGLTASRLAALNHGSIVSMLPNQEARLVAAMLRQLSAQFGEIRLSGSDDNPRVDLAIVGVDTDGILQDAWHADDDAARRRMVKELLWAELKLTDDGAFETQDKVIWRGTGRIVDVLLDNVRDADRMPSTRFAADPGTTRVVFDLPFDDGHYPSDHRLRVHGLQAQLGGEHTLVWLAHFLSDDRKADLSNLIRINFVLERDRVAELRPNFTVEERHHARVQLESRRSALTTRLREALRRAYGVNQPDAADLGARADDQVLSLTHGLEPRIQAGQGLRTALERLCQQMLDHLYPEHPDFDPNGQGRDVKGSELDTVVNVVKEAAQDKVGRYEVPTHGERAIMKKIATPLKIGVMHEGPFVLSRDWPLLIERNAAGRPEFSVRQLREWVIQERQGLPDLVRDLVVVCYAIQADKAWMRAGQQIAMPPLARLTDDMILRSQELPSTDEFDLASRRAAGIFGAPREPVRSARSTQAIAQAVRDKSKTLLPAAESALAELEKHAVTLGLDATQPRLVTARLLAELLNRLAATADPTATLRLLASAELPRENAIYAAHLRAAATLTGELRSRNWTVLDDLAACAASGDDTDAAAIFGPLQAAACHDEHEVSLADQLRQADHAALDLIMSRTKASTQKVSAPPAAVPTTPKGMVTRRVPATKVASVAAEICEAANENQGAEFEITWRVVAE